MTCTQAWKWISISNLHLSRYLKPGKGLWWGQQVQLASTYSFEECWSHILIFLLLILPIYCTFISYFHKYHIIFSSAKHLKIYYWNWLGKIIFIDSDDKGNLAERADNCKLFQLTELPVKFDNFIHFVDSRSYCNKFFFKLCHEYFRNIYKA